MAAKPSLQMLRAAVASGPPYPAHLLASLQADPRTGAQALHTRCLRRIARVEREAARLRGMQRYETEAHAQGFARVAGVDEAGRGPLAGPIVAGAVVLASNLPGLDDSKRLSAARREELFAALTAGDHAIGCAVIDAADVDRLGIQAANYAAMAQAVDKLDPKPDFLLVDGFAIRGCGLPQNPVVKGDRKSMSIAAASIIAKVTRDRIMNQLASQFPGYGFAQNKGYGTQNHLDALRRLGPSPAHRRSFAPVGGRRETGLLFNE